MVGRPKRSPISFTRAGVSLPCNCMRSGARGVDDAVQRVVVCVDAERDDLRPSLRLPSQNARGRPVDMARAFGKKYEPDHVRAGLERGVERHGRGKAADFDDGRHRALLSVKAPALSKATETPHASRSPETAVSQDDPASARFLLAGIVLRGRHRAFGKRPSLDGRRRRLTTRCGGNRPIWLGCSAARRSAAHCVPPYPRRGCAQARRLRPAPPRASWLLRRGKARRPAGPDR